ncbi:hypothetical protein RISK_003561 [Rhodopirellula islandica]|uniref:Uncharacterized protein n=1 Tax=Rhodopirellula islandica TaxID=595434 RepID=A0A0J1BD16_RHOIS|nr:hypothetical protein RISK_003561 [Rhodopirellula islandica]
MADWLNRPLPSPGNGNRGNVKGDGEPNERDFAPQRHSAVVGWIGMIA